MRTGLIGACATLVTALAIAVTSMTAHLASPLTASAAAARVSGFQRALYQLPYLRWEAQNHLQPKTVSASATPPAGAMSSNLQFIANLPMPSAISIAFDGDWAYVSTVTGLYAVNISDPTNPLVEGSVPMYIWENEHMQLDQKRHLLIVSRDPRGFTSPGTTAYPYGALQIFDVSHPPAMVQISYHQQPTGHTATCINDCQYLWVAGPASPAVQVPGGANPNWGGRPTWVVNISNPMVPEDCGGPGLNNGTFIDTNNDHGMTDYDHDADVDANGVAWISGSRHVRGFWTAGAHFNYVDGRMETATPCNPIPYAGGNTVEGWLGNPNTTAQGVIHDSEHNLSVLVDGRPDVLATTEEVTVTDCRYSGRMITYDIGNSYNAAGWKDPNLTLQPLDYWTPQNKPGSDGCDSAHWFTDNGHGLLAFAFYSQGMRLLDINDPRHVQQVGYYNVKDATGASSNDTWSAFWHGDNYIYVADFTRGLDILKYNPAMPANQPSTQVTNVPSGSTSAPVFASGSGASQAASQLPQLSQSEPAPTPEPGTELPAPAQSSKPVAALPTFVYVTAPWLPLLAIALWFLFLSNLGGARSRLRR